MKLLKKYYAFPAFLLYLFLIAAVVSFAMLFYLETLIGSFNYGFLFLAAVFLFGFSCYKTWLVEKFG